MIKPLVRHLALLLMLLSLLPSVVPGAMFMMGFLLSLVALLLSVFSVAAEKTFYFYASVALFLSGMLLFNDTLRLWGALPISIITKLVTYAAALLLLFFCARFVHGLSRRH